MYVAYTYVAYLIKHLYMVYMQNMWKFVDADLFYSFYQDVSVNDVVKAIEVTEEEIDDEVSGAVRSASRPGRLDKVR